MSEEPVRGEGSSPARAGEAARAFARSPLRGESKAATALGSTRSTGRQSAGDNTI